MPLISEIESYARMVGALSGVHPRLGGDLISTPSDVLEGAGDFLDADGDGNPDAFRLGQPQIPDGRHVYVGLTPDSTTRQTHRPLNYDRPSHVVDYEIVEGPPPPKRSTPLLAQVPTPKPPKLKAIPVSRPGYTPSTPLKPWWFAWAWVKNGALTLSSPAVAFELANGQSISCPLPEEAPEGIFHLALLLGDPLTSRPNAPGKLHVQRIVDLRRNVTDSFTLSGPFRRDLGAVGPTNKTVLPAPGAPALDHRSAPIGCRVSHYTAKIVWTDAQGNTMAGPQSRRVSVNRNDRFCVKKRNDDGTTDIVFDSGAGYVAVTRPRSVPNGATGWRVYLYMQPFTLKPGFGAGWRLVEDRFNDRGNERPFPISQTVVTTSGWFGDEEFYGNNDATICVDADPPDENTTGIPSPEDEPPAPVAVGTARPEADRLFVRVTETVDGIESLPSRAVALNIGSDELLNVVFSYPHNLVQNPTFLETDPEDLPLQWQIDKTGGFASVDEDGDLVFGTNASTSAATPEVATDAFDVDPQKTAQLVTEFDVEPPLAGSASGAAEIVLQELDENGAPSAPERVIATRSAVGQYAVRATLGAASSAAQVRWASETRKATVKFRFAGVAKHILMRLRHLLVKPAKPKPPRKPPKPRPPRKPSPVPRPPGRPRPARPAPPITVIADPPEPPLSPETTPMDRPDRPLTTGTIRQSFGFETGIPADMKAVSTGSGSVAAEAASAIEGTQGLTFKKTLAGSLSSATAEKSYPSATPHPAHCLGSYVRNRLKTAPINGAILLHPLCRTSDGARFAWLEASTASEKLELKIEAQPLSGGNVSIGLHTDPAVNVPVSSVKDVRDLSVAAPTSPGTCRITVGGVAYNVTAGGVQQNFSLAITAIPTTAGVVVLTVNGVARRVRVAPYTKRRRNGRTIFAPTTTAAIAELLRDAGYPGYTVTRARNVLTFVANLPGTRPAPSFNHNSTRTGATLTVLAPGGPETADEFASRIRSTKFEGYQTSTGASASVVRFTADAGGPKPQPGYSAGTTGSGSTFALVQTGSIDNAFDLAAKIRSASFPGWTTSGSGTTVLFEATTNGFRQKSSYSAGPTGAKGTMRTTRQGTEADLIAYARDADGTIQSRRIFRSLAPTTVFNTDVTVSGAGTTRAVVTVWGSLGSAPLEHLMRFENVDLTGYDATLAKYGVDSETDAGLTWELHSDAASVTDRGKTWHRDHNAKGRWINQIEAYYEEGQPVSQDLLLQDGRAPLVPGHTYTLSAYLRADVSDAATLRPRPIVAVAHEFAIRGQSHPLGCVTDAQPLAPGSDTPWLMHSLTFVAPTDCHALTLSSKDIAAGGFVLQEVVVSPGTSADRSQTYRANGLYETTFDLSTPESRDNLRFWSSERIDAGALTEAPEGSTITSVFSSADPSPEDPSVPGPFTQPKADWRAVPHKAFLKASFEYGSQGAQTAVLSSGSPHVEFVLKATETRRMSTLLDGERRELPGGVAFAFCPEWFKRTPDGRRLLPSGRLADDPRLFDAVGVQPESEILVFNENAKRILEEEWKKPFVLEQYGREALTLKLSEPPVLERVSAQVHADGALGTRQSIWKGTLPASEVTRNIRIPS